MQLRLIFSLTLNALLLGLVLWLALAGPRSATRNEASRCLTEHSLMEEHQPARPPATEPPPGVVEVNEPFHWAQIESADYRVYLANLRALGCPEATVRDILIADVNDLFAVRVKALVDEVTGRFWQLIIRQDDFTKMVDEKETQLRALRHERDEIFTALFGSSNPRAEEDERTSAAAQREHWERLADFLPVEKRAQFAAAKEELERAWRDYLRTPGQQTGAQQQAKRKELVAAHEQALREWLTPDELDELRLRQSPAASLPHQLVGLDLSEELVQAVAKIQFTPSAQPADVQIRELLGPDGYAAFQRATDSRYKPLFLVSQRLELPDATAAQAYAIRRQAEDAASRLRDNQALSAEERQARLQAISAETKQSLATALGSKGFAAYEKTDRGWMQQLMVVKR